MMLAFFRTAVRAGSTRAVLTVVVGMMVVLVYKTCKLIDGAAGYKPARRDIIV